MTAFKIEYKGLNDEDWTRTELSFSDIEEAEMMIDIAKDKDNIELWGIDEDVEWRIIEVKENI